MRGGEIGQADVADGTASRSDDDGRAVEFEPVDEIGGEEGCGGLRPALDIKL